MVSKGNPALSKANISSEAVTTQPDVSGVTHHCRCRTHPTQSLTGSSPYPASLRRGDLFWHTPLTIVLLAPVQVNSKWRNGRKRRRRTFRFSYHGANSHDMPGAWRRRDGGVRDHPREVTFATGVVSQFASGVHIYTLAGVRAGIGDPAPAQRSLGMNLVGCGTQRARGT